MADTVFEPSETDLAYAAGLIDGEGTISVSEYAVRADRRSPQFRWHVSVMLTDARPLVWLARTFGGTVHSYPPRKPGHQGVSYWRLSNRRAAVFCELLLPYLQIKREQADLALAFYNDPTLCLTRHGGRGPQLPADELGRRRVYVGKIRTLNRRGA